MVEEDKYWEEFCENAFMYHPPKDGHAERYVEIRDKAKELGLMICELCPDSSEKAYAISSLREAVMWANASIACNE